MISIARTDFTEESDIMSVSAFTQNISPLFSKMYCTLEGRIAFQQEAKLRELRKRQRLACAIAEEGRRRTIAEEELRRAKRMRTDTRVHMKKTPVEEGQSYAIEHAIEHAKARAKMEKELAKMEKELVDEEEQTYVIEHAIEHAKARAKMEKALAKVEKAEKELADEKEKERAKESAKMRMRKKRAESNRNLESLSDDDMMTAVLQSLGHPRTMGVDLLSIYTLWLFRATNTHKNGHRMNRLALMKAFAVEYVSIAQ